MERNYWLSRKTEEAELARSAASTEARLAHHDLATRYDAKAMQAQTDSLAGWGGNRVGADQYWVNGFRYAIAGDSIAEAQRRTIAS